MYFNHFPLNHYDNSFCIIGCCDRLELTSSGSLENDEYENFLLGTYILDLGLQNGKSVYKHSSGSEKGTVFTFNDRRNQWAVSKILITSNVK